MMFRVKPKNELPAHMWIPLRDYQDAYINVSPELFYQKSWPGSSLEVFDDFPMIFLPLRRTGNFVDSVSFDYPCYRVPVKYLEEVTVDFLGEFNAL